KTLQEVGEAIDKPAGSIHHMLERARERGIIQLVAPYETGLESKLVKEFKCLTKEVLRVVNVPQVLAPSGSSSSAGAGSVSGYAKEPHHPGEYVSASAADLVMTLVKKVGETHWERGEPVTIGLGPGRATRDFCQHFSYLLQTDGGFSFVDSKT